MPRERRWTCVRKYILRPHFWSTVLPKTSVDESLVGRLDATGLGKLVALPSRIFRSDHSFVPLLTIIRCGFNTIDYRLDCRVCGLVLVFSPSADATSQRRHLTVMCQWAQAGKIMSGYRDET